MTEMERALMVQLKEMTAQNAESLIQIENLTNLLTAANDQIIILNQAIDQMRETVDVMVKRQHGSKSEKTKRKDDDEPGGALPKTGKTPATKKSTPRKAKKQTIENLPVEEHVTYLTEEQCVCEFCDETMTNRLVKCIRESVKFIPAQLIRVREIVETALCRCQESKNDLANIVQAKAPNPIFKNSLATPSLLAHIMYQKFVLSVPFHRQLQDWTRMQFDISTRTMSNWIINGAHRWLVMMYDLLHERLQLEPVIHADETTYKILRRPDGKPGSTTAYIWLFQTGEYAENPIILYRADPSRKRDVITEVLPDFQGFLQCDGYAAYQNIPGISVVGCWAHARRKFTDITTPGKHTLKAIQLCNRIFEAERALITLPIEERLEKRQTLVKPLVDAFDAYVDSVNTVKGYFEKAIKYARNQRQYLRVFLTNGLLVASNNSAERNIKPIALGRKNHMFSGSLKGANANAIVYTLIETAKAHKVDPYKYLEYLFTHLPNLESCVENIHDIQLRSTRKKALLEEFLPWEKTIQQSCALAQ